MKAPNSTLAGLPTTVFESMSRLAWAYGAINLGQGFPDDRGDEDILAAAADAILTGANQYPPMLGLPALRQAVADHDRRFYGLDIDFNREVMVTSGATEALAASLLAWIEPGDEVVLIEPMYDAYAPMVARAGGVPRFITLSPPDWRLSEAAIAAAVTPATKVVLLNNPLNPAARVFSDGELKLLADAVIAADAVLIADEVYEHIVFDGRRPDTMLTRPGMRERTIRIASAGKTFSLTGWKVGYITAAPDLLRPIAKAHQFLVFTTPPNLQVAVAHGLGKSDTFFTGLAADMQRRRDRLSTGLRDVGIPLLPCEGTYFLNIDLTGTPWQEDDVAFCRALVAQVGVAAIPLSAFCHSGRPSSVVRLCFAKQDTVLDAAIERFAHGLPNR